MSIPRFLPQQLLPMSDSRDFMRIEACACCDAHSFDVHPVLWPGLANEWRLSQEETEYINRQQGVTCKKCGNTLRSIALAKAILSARGHKGNFSSFVWSPRNWLLQILKINTAGTLTNYLSRMPRRTLALYPDVDMLQLPYESDRFDLVVHSDTLEHVSSPVTALSECLRVLKPGGGSAVLQFRLLLVGLHEHGVVCPEVITVE